MGDSANLLPPLESLDLDAIRRGLKELSETLRNSNEEPELSAGGTEQFLKDCALNVESKIKEIVLDYSDVQNLALEDMDAYITHLKVEIESLAAENAKVSEEIDALTRASLEDSNELESNLEVLQHSLKVIESQDIGDAKAHPSSKFSTDKENYVDLVNSHDHQQFEVLKLCHQIEQNKIGLKSLQDLDSKFERFEAVEKIEDALTGLKVVEFEGNCIKLTMKTYLPDVDCLLREQKITDIFEPSEIEHELLIEVTDGTMELKNAKIFPDDVYIGEIIDTAKSFRLMFSHLSLVESRSSLEWFVRKVQDRIILCTLRRFLVKAANKSRHSFEYSDMEHAMVAHMAIGVDVFIKMPQGWPLINSELMLLSLERSAYSSQGISTWLCCKIKEMAKSVDSHKRQNLSSFVDAIEEILVQQMQLELNSSIMPGK